MLKLVIVVFVSLFTLNSFAEKEIGYDPVEAYKRCRELQQRGFKINCVVPFDNDQNTDQSENESTEEETEEVLTAYQKCRELQKEGFKIGCKGLKGIEANEEEACIIRKGEDASSVDCDGETWVRVKARLDGTLGESEDVKGLEVVDVPTDVSDFLEGEVQDQITADIDEEVASAYQE